VATSTPGPAETWIRVVLSLRDGGEASQKVELEPHNYCGKGIVHTVARVKEGRDVEFGARRLLDACAFPSR
jgi:hypothetical protein